MIGIDSNGHDLNQQLQAGERMLWSGHPRRGLLLRPSDAYLIPFSLMWFGFTMFWEPAVVTGDAPLILMVWGIPFLIMGIYFTIGRFFVDARVRARTAYGLTNQRILIATGSPSAPSLHTLPLEMLGSISLKTRSNGTGTIVFGDSHPLGKLYPGVHLPACRSYIPSSSS
ncbi:MAG: hypothetical protein R2706_10075 [Acidimicrobiales bacterium]